MVILAGLIVFQTNQNGPVGTNKFYAGFFLGDQSNAVWTYPYSLSWSKGIGNAKSWGLSVSHSRADQRVSGVIICLLPDDTLSPANTELSRAIIC